MKMNAALSALAFAAAVTWAPASLHAMFAPYSDRELVAKSEVVVLGEYLGQTEVRLGGPAGTLWLGVVAVREVLKGDPREKVLLIAVPSPAKPVSGSDIFFRPGQEGLWLVAARPGGPTGIYVADHPQRFVAAGADQARIAALRKLLPAGRRE